jgi:hypothetical protein
MKPSGTYHPPEGWVKFSTLKEGEKFHDIFRGQPVQFIETVPEGECNAVNFETGSHYLFDQDEFVYPTDAGWIAELECYGKIPDEVKKQGHKAIIAHIFQNSEGRKADWRWRAEIAKYYPSIQLMSFSGAGQCIKWLLEEVKKENEKRE